MMLLEDLGWIDLSMLAVLLMSVVAGVLRGLVSELMSLAGWFVAWLLSQAWGGDVARMLRRLELAERRMLARDCPRIWGAAYPLDAPPRRDRGD